MLFTKNCWFFSINVVYSSPEPQFVRVWAILNEEKITPQWLRRETDYDFLAGM